MTHTRNVLFIPSGSIGDALMMLVLCTEIHQYQSDATFTIIARRNAALMRDLARAYPYIEITPIAKSPLGLLRLIWEVFRKPYQVLMPAAFGKSWFLNTELLFRMLALRPGTRTYGLLKREGDANPYSVGFAYAPNALHIDNMRRLARAAGFTVEPEGSSITYRFDSRLPKNFTLSPRTYLIFHPYGSSSWKSLPFDRCRSLVERLSEHYPTYSIVVTGGEEDKEDIARMIKDIPRTISVAGVPILEAIGVIEGARVYVGVDTGTLHLACALKKQVVALEHGAGPEWWPTYNPNVVMLTDKANCTCGGSKQEECLVHIDGKLYTKCMLGIREEDVLGAVDAFLAHPEKGT